MASTIGEHDINKSPRQTVVDSMGDDDGCGRWMRSSCLTVH